MHFVAQPIKGLGLVGAVFSGRKRKKRSGGERQPSAVLSGSEEKAMMCATRWEADSRCEASGRFSSGQKVIQQVRGIRISGEAHRSLRLLLLTP
jgi:hypothetical protein